MRRLQGDSQLRAVYRSVPSTQARGHLRNLVRRPYFTTLDLTHAYNQLMLDEDSRKYITINTHKGLYQYTRLPFGIASAPAVFQRAMDTILQGVEGKYSSRAPGAP